MALSTKGISIWTFFDNIVNFRGSLTIFLSQKPCPFCEKLLNIARDNLSLKELRVLYLPNDKDSHSEDDEEIAEEFENIKKDLLTLEKLDEFAKEWRKKNL